MNHYPIGVTQKQTEHGLTMKITEMFFDGVYCVRRVQHGRLAPYMVVLKNDVPISNGTDKTDPRAHVLIPDADGCIRGSKIYFER